MRALVLLLAAANHWPAVTSDAKPAGCQVQDSKIEGQPKVWLVYGFLVFSDGTKKTYLFAHREANERKKALLDCNDFIEHYEKQSKKREDAKK